MTQSTPPAEGDEQTEPADASPADATDDTEHPVGEEQARRNAENELPG